MKPGSDLIVLQCDHMAKRTINSNRPSLMNIHMRGTWKSFYGPPKKLLSQGRTSVPIYEIFAVIRNVHVTNGANLLQHGRG